MGYSASTPIRNRKLQQWMLKFLRENMRPAHQINPEILPEMDWTRDVTDDLCYDDSTVKIGFSFSHSGFFLGEYAFAILHWMALRVGAKRRLKGYSEPVPYYRYDGSDCIPVLLRSTWEGRTKDWWSLVDEDGFKPLRRWWLPYSNRADGHVETALITSAPRDVLDKLLNEDLVVTSKGDSHRVESLEPTGLVFLREKLKAAGYASDVEFGPLVLSPFRKSLDDTYEPGIRAESEILKSELSRLSKLWDDYQEAP